MLEIKNEHKKSYAMSENARRSKQMTSMLEREFVVLHHITEPVMETSSLLALFAFDIKVQILMLHSVILSVEPANERSGASWL